MLGYLVIPMILLYALSSLTKDPKKRAYVYIPLFLLMIAAVIYAVVK